MNSDPIGCYATYSGGKYRFVMHNGGASYNAYRPIIKLKNSVKLVEGENGLLDIVEK